MTARCGRGHPRTWTAEEDVILLNSVRGTERKCWKQIALKFKDRTGKQCRQRYKYHLEQELKTGDWTPEEDEIIIQMQAKIGNCWSKISKALPGRSDNAVKNRWHCTLYRSEKKNKYFPNEHKQIELDPVLVEAIVEERITCDESWIDSKTETVSNACKESSRRRTPTAPWTPEEDQKLVSAVNKVGMRNWTLVSKALDGQRTGKQCRARYKQHLMEDTRTGGWTAEEDAIILREQARIGNCWAQISRFLPGRSDNSVKNRWYSTLKNFVSRKCGSADGEDESDGEVHDISSSTESSEFQCMESDSYGQCAGDDLMVDEHSEVNQRHHSAKDHGSSLSGWQIRESLVSASRGSLPTDFQLEGDSKMSCRRPDDMQTASSRKRTTKEKSADRLDLSPDRIVWRHFRHMHLLRRILSLPEAEFSDKKLGQFPPGEEGAALAEHLAQVSCDLSQLNEHFHGIEDINDGSWSDYFA